MSEPSTTANTFEPDWEDLTNILWDHLDRYMEWPDAQSAADAVIAEYQRQAAAAGLVMVAAEHLAFVLDCYESMLPKFNYETAAQGDIRRLREEAGLAATPEPTPGGDGS
jgi:UDP-N-acetylmuramoylalanine-D-glutamate ligase